MDVNTLSYVEGVRLDNRNKNLFIHTHKPSPIA
jgi:hypothetical protein